MFDERGMIQFSDLNEIKDIDFNESLYENMKKYAIENYKLYQNYQFSEDHIYNFLKGNQLT